MKTYHADYAASLVANRTTGAQWLISVGYDAASTLYFAHKDCNLTGAGEAIGCSIAVSGMQSSIDPVSATWSHGRVSVVLADATIGGAQLSGITNKTLAGLFRQKQFIGRALSIWRINDAMDDVTGHDKEFYGFISDVTQSVDGSTFTIVADSWYEKSRKIIPQTEINETDYPLAPKESYGQRLPIVYGTFEHLLDSSDERDLLINNFHFAPSVCVDASIGKFVFAHHEINSLANTDIALFDTSAATYFCGLYAYTGSTNRPSVSTSAPASTTLTTPAGLYYWTADAMYLIPEIKGGKDDDKTTEREHLYNQLRAGGSAKFVTTGTNQYCTQRFVSLSGSPEFWQTALAADCVLWVYISSTTGSPTYRLIVWNGITGAGDESATGGTVPGWHSYNFGNFGDRSDNGGTAITSTVQWGFDELGRYEYGVKCETSGDTIEIQGICLQIKKPIISTATYIKAQEVVRPNNQIERPPSQNPWDVWTYERLGYGRPRISNIESITNTISRSGIFAELKGREFGTWVDDVGRSNTKSSGDLINESSFQIESILRDELGFGNSTIDVADFDAAESGRSNTHYSISQPVDAYRVISDLSMATMSITFPSSGGKWKHYIMPSDPEGDATYDQTFDWSEIIPRDFYNTGLNNLCNKLNLSYHFDYGKNAFTKHYKKEDATSQGSTSSGYGSVFDKTLSIPFYRFNSTSGATNYAEDFGDLYVGHWKNTHSVFEFDVTNHAKFSTEEGDVITFTNFERNIGAIGAGSAGNYWSSIYSPGTIYWLIVSREPYLDMVKYTAINLHQLV